MSDDRRYEIQELLDQAGGLVDGASRQVAEATGVPEAEVYGVGSFYHLLARPDAKIRVCTGLSCRMAGADEVLKAAELNGLPVEGCTCLAGCDVAPAVLRDKRVLPSVRVEDIHEAKGDWQQLRSAANPDNEVWFGAVGPEVDDPDNLVLNLLGAPDWSGAAFQRAVEMGADAVVGQIEGSGLQGRGGAGFPAHIKWNGTRNQPVTTRYMVLNADEGEPGTFKDREVLLRRPDRVLEGLAIAAHAIGATEVWLYLRGEFEVPWEIVEDGIRRFEESGALGDINFHLHAGHGAYICGEETALLEALEGKRGMPRLKPPFPVEVGLWGKPTLIHNVETIACVPAIIERGGEWFKALGRDEAGTKLYCISGDVRQPGTYELPLGVTLDELAEAAGGYEGELAAFSPGGASSGFLPASMREVPLAFKSLGSVGSMLGSAGVVVLNSARDLRDAVMTQLRFFEAESCGQCAPCRIGTRYLAHALDRNIQDSGSAGNGSTGSASDGDGAAADGSAGDGTPGAALQHVAAAAWQMNEGSICGLGQAAPLPLTLALQHFPEAFE